MTRVGDIHALMRIAGRQAGVVSRAQAERCGFSRKAQRRRAAAGQWVPHGNALVVSPQAVDPDLRQAWMLWIEGGLVGAVTGRLAMRLGGLWVPTSDRVLVVPSSARPQVTNARVIRRLHPPPACDRGGLRLVMPNEAILDALCVGSRQDAEALADRTLQNRWLSPTQLVDLIDRRRAVSARGTAHLVHVAARVSTGARSEAEHRIRPALRQAGGAWIANYVVRDASGRVVAEIDFADPELMLAIEVDGRAHHVDRASFERDRARQNMLALMGWTVLRFTWEQITTDRRGVVHTVRVARRQRLAQLEGIRP